MISTFYHKVQKFGIGVCWFGDIIWQKISENNKFIRFYVRLISVFLKSVQIHKLGIEVRFHTQVQNYEFERPPHVRVCSNDEERTRNLNIQKKKEDDWIVRIRLSVYDF